MASGPSFRLTVRRGPQPNQVYDLAKDVVTIGRDITNDVVVNDPEVSRHHTRLVRSGNTYSVEDLDSTNGTFVNGRRIGPSAQIVAHGDMLGIGETVTLAFEAIGAGPPQSTAVSQPQQAPAAQQAGYYDEEESFLQANRTIIIGCAVVLLVGCCVLAAAGLFLPSDVWCQIPVGNQIPYLCVP